MNKNNIFLVTVLFFAATVFSQSKKETLMTINGNPVYASEFKSVYQKNLELVQDDSQKNIDAYLDLFIDYKLKIAEARAQGLHEKPLYQKEFLQYQDQLSRNYIFEDKVTLEIAKEAYQRSLEEINASHILIRIGYDAMPNDTLRAYNKISEAREKALKGEDFAKLAATYSEEPNAKDSEGNLGYFTVFKMVYPFETAAYNTKEGGISEIVRTQFGYHIIKVNDRRKKMPKIGVSHIMISDNKGPKTFNPEERVNEIYTLLQQGESFESLAKQFSDDKNSAVKDGKLNAFTKGDLRSESFEDAAYAIKNPGEISKPVKTDFGWHIIRLDETFPLATFESEREMLEKQVAEPGRSKIVTNAVNKNIKDKYGFKKGNDYTAFFDKYLGEDYLNRKWDKDSLPTSENKVVYTIGERDLWLTDFGNYVYERKSKSRPSQLKGYKAVDFFEEFETQELKNYFKYKLEEDNPEYASILGEYRDGLLIFDVMNLNIWQKAQTDSLGLQEFYNRSKNQYISKEGITGEILSATDKTIAERAQKLFLEGKTAIEIKQLLNTNETVNIILTHGLFEIGQRELPENLEMKTGVSKVYPHNGSFVVINVIGVNAPGIQSLENIKGRALSDYQNDLEEKWMQELRNKYKVEVNKKVLKRVKKDLM